MPRIFQFCYFSSSFLPVTSYYMLLSNWEKKQIVPWKLILRWTIIAILVLLRCWWNSAESLGSHTICSLLDHHRHSLSVWKLPSLEIEAHVVFVRATLRKTPSLTHAFIHLDIKWWSVNMLLKHTMVIFSLCHFALNYAIIWMRPNCPLYLFSILKNWNLYSIFVVYSKGSNCGKLSCGQHLINAILNSDTRFW